MIFLLNMNIPRELGRKLEAQGHLWRHVGNIGMSRANDVAIIKEARANGEVIVTYLFIRIKDLWPEIERPLLGGAIVVIEDDAVRIRRLPIDREE